MLLLYEQGIYGSGLGSQLRISPTLGAIADLPFKVGGQKI